ncbi:MAG: diguanylate cyclase response regulator [Thermodesulfovibrio sp.]|nr:diguanylate cyclase response regulator [Thermodesulfovibrio sp.]
MNNLHSIVLITGEIALKTVIEKILGNTYRVSSFSNIQSSLDFIYNAIPDLMIITIDAGDEMTISLLNGLKSDPIFGQLPVLAIFTGEQPFRTWEQLLVDDYLNSSRIETDLLMRVALCLSRAERVVDINPLTRLPGNIAIMKQVQTRLNNLDTFALAYADLDFFKPFNDKYGFSRGDEVLKMVGRLILNIVKSKQPHDSFVGHIGGDDFVFITSASLLEETAAEILRNFDQIIPTFYDPGDRTERSIESVDRGGKKQVFPFISISVGIALNTAKPFSHYGEMTEVASEMKKYAKQFTGSAYKIDRRRG